MMMQEHHRQDFEGAWGAGPGSHPRPPRPPPPGAMMAAQGPGSAGAGAAGWANEFHGPGVREPMMHQPHPAELEAAWGAPAEILGPGPRPMLYGPAGPPPPPALGPGFTAPGMNGQVTSTLTTSATPTTTGVVASSSTGDAHNEVVGGGRRTEVAGVDVVAAGVDEGVGGGGEEVGSSARALAGQMAGDPDGRFRDSELLRFASQLGTGGLRVSGDKVLSSSCSSSSFPPPFFSSPLVHFFGTIHD